MDSRHLGLRFGSDAVRDAVQGSHAEFVGLAGLPLLRKMNYAGDHTTFSVSFEVQS